MITIWFYSMAFNQGHYRSIDYLPVLVTLDIITFLLGFFLGRLH
jgi:hypothetical protein